jgi:metallo-beta-lactamase family protein
MGLKIQFLGAAKTVTGSRYLLESEAKKYLVDCGLFQGYKELRLQNWQPFPVKPATIDAVLLTHAHIDHSGNLPLLVKQGFRGPIYASPATIELTKILLLDSGRLQEEDAKRANRYGYSKHKPALPLYTEEDAENSIRQFKVVEYHERYNLDEQLSFSFLHAGHILGSSMISIEGPFGKISFTGDLGRLNDPLLLPPETISETDYLVIESTYGNREHPPEEGLQRFAEIINTTVAKGGSVIIPSFAVGRSQTLLYFIKMMKDQNMISKTIPVYLDSPMAQDVTRLLCRFEGEHKLTDNECELVSHTARYTRTVEESKAINQSKTPSIVISASGMAEGGRILHHIAFYGPHPENTIVFAGYQAGGTRGALLLSGAKELKIHGEIVPINARVERLEFLSSHVDSDEEIQWLRGLKKPPKCVFLTHGEPEAAEAMKKKIVETFGWNVVVPDPRSVFDL